LAEIRHQPGCKGTPGGFQGIPMHAAECRDHAMFGLGLHARLATPHTLREGHKPNQCLTALLNLKQCCADVTAFEIRILASSIEKQLVLDAFMQI
jgi:hypothetical protein